MRLCSGRYGKHAPVVALFDAACSARGFVLVLIAVFLNNIGIPLPSETILLGTGFILGKAGGSPW
jgi:membrane protein DedA with SNARE-associated domain